MSAALCIQVCVSAEQYARSLRPVGVAPCSRTLHGAFAARAARKHTMFAMLPPLTKMPVQVGSYRISEASHRIVCSSISVATGERAQAPTFGLTAAARSSPSIPMGAGDEVM